MSSDLDIHLPGIVAGDARAFAAWLAGAELPIRRSLRRFASQVDVEAVLQESLLRVWQVAPRVRTDSRPNALLRFALRVARNHAIDVARRNRSQPLETAPVVESATCAPPDPLLVRALTRCREKLRGPPAAALGARLEGGGSDAVLAERVGMSRNTFLKNVGRARKLLLACLSARGIEVNA